LITESYRSVAATFTSLLSVKNSKFIAVIFPCSSLENFKIELTQLKKQHPKASHFCHATAVLENDIIFRSSDDGEPSGTAGLPILGQLKSAQLIQVGLIVIRYYGGTKLGASGLIQAYKESARLVIESADVIVIEQKIRFEIQGAYGVLMGLVSRCAKYDWKAEIKVSADQHYLLEIMSSESEKEKVNEMLSKINDINSEIIYLK